MKISITLATACCLLTACAPAPYSPYLSHTQPDAWYALEKTDAFTDKESCSVSVRPPNYPYGAMYMYFPFIETNSKGLFVGIKSLHGISVGDVQIRIDDNAAWDISTSETPIVLQPTNPTGQGVEGNQHFEQAYKQTMDAMTKITSPFTSATGEKAAAILTEMLNGKEMIYRTVAMNQPGSSTGKVALDASLMKALKDCNIPTPKKAAIQSL